MSGDSHMWISIAVLGSVILGLGGLFLTARPSRYPAGEGDAVAPAGNYPVMSLDHSDCGHDHAGDCGGHA